MAKHKLACILTAWKRDYFQEQINAIRMSTHPPDDIYLWQNGGHLDLHGWCKTNNVTLITTDADFGYYGRFAIALLMKSDFTLIMDDDVIPGPKYIETALKVAQDGAVAGIHGLTLPIDWPFYEAKPEHLGLETRIKHPESDTEVDICLSGSLFETKLARYLFWHEPPPTTNGNGEDIHFSAVCAVEGHPVVIPSQPTPDHYSTMVDYGCDQFSSWMIESDRFQQERFDAYQYWRESIGWVPLEQRRERQRKWESTP